MDETGMRRVAAAIVLKAVKDWRSLIRAHAWKEQTIFNKNFTELRRFFKSDYCRMLLTATGVDPLDILKVLEKELEEAKKNPEPRKYPTIFDLYF